MSKDFLPHANPELLVWSTNFAQRIIAAPLPLGLTVLQAATYQTAHDLWAGLVATALEPSTRTRGTISAANDARTPLKAMARELARIVNAYPPITNQQRINLGLNPRTGEVSPINPPQEQPVMEVAGAIGRTLKVKVHAIDSTRKKPEGVSGCTVFYFVGSAPPADITQWVFAGSSTRTVFDVEFPATVAAGAQVWLCAFWKNFRDQSGPACQPISAYLAGGVTGSGGAQQQAA
ncbi:MAG: hypothetical protein WBD40_13810 [Tepidisphaeraceae bacterium]